MDFPRIEAQMIGLDYETNHLKYWLPDFQVFMVGVATEDAEWSFDLRTSPGARDWLRDLLLSRETVVAHNAQFEYQCSRVLGIDPRKVGWYCSMVSDCLIDEHHLTYNLEDVYNRWARGTSRKSQDLEAIRVALGVARVTEALPRLTEAPSDLVGRYCSGDAREGLLIALSQEKELDKQELWRVHRLEMDLLPVLADMSWNGVRVDTQGATEAIPLLNEQEERLQEELDQIVGGKFNANSTPQIRDLFKPEQLSKWQYRLIDGTLVGATKGAKGPSIDQKALREIRHPAAAKILALRKTIKLRDTFLRGHILGNADSHGYVHTTFNQTRNDADAGTITGRLSSTDPALQQITKRDKENAAILRSKFLPDPDEQWFCADYSQVDFRCAAHLINDTNIVAAYAENPALDYHQAVSDMTGIPRNPVYAGAPNTKQINLGLMFGAGAGKVAFMMGMEYELIEKNGRAMYLPGPEAKKIFETYHSRIPGAKAFAKYAENVAKERGYVRTLTGRRLRFNSGEHKAAGLLYQAYAADLHKIGLVRVDKRLRDIGNPGRLMVSVHDEIGVSMRPDEEVKQIIIQEYTDFHSDKAPVKMRIPITASGDYGVNWYEASKD